MEFNDGINRDSDYRQYSNRCCKAKNCEHDVHNYHSYQRPF
nr:MAG TPA: hypothetical protein [Caudoviricetes sp.]